MINLTEKHHKLIAHLEELYLTHRELDKEIDLLYNKFAPDGEVTMLKTKKLWFKDEIHRIETELKELNE